MPFTPPDTDEILQAWSPPDDDELVSVSPQNSPLAPPSESLLAAMVDPQGWRAGQVQESAKEEFGGLANEQLIPWSPPSLPSLRSTPGYEDASPLATVPQDAARAAYNTLIKGGYDFINTPLGFVTLGAGNLPKLGQRALAGLFGAHMTKGAAEAAGEASVTGDTQQAMEAGLMAAPVPFLTRPLVRYGENVALTPRDAEIVGSRELGQQISRAELPVPEPNVLRELGVSVPPSPFFNPGVRDIASRAIEEAQGRDVILPGAESAISELRRAVEPQPVIEVPSMVKPEPLGGQISFASPAEAGAVPSARQAVNFFDRQSEIAGLERPSTPPTLESIRAQREFERRQNAIQPETAQPVQPLRQEPVQVQREVPTAQDRSQIDAGGGQRTASQTAEIDRWAALDAPGFDRAVKESGIGVTSNAYRLAERLKAEDIPALEAAQKKAHAERKEAAKNANTPEAFAQTMALGMKGQMFGEAIKWRKALDEARRSNTTMTEDFAALERKYGVGESNRFGGDLRDALNRELASERAATTAESVLSNKVGETSHEAIGSMPDVELNKVFDARTGQTPKFSPHTDGVSYGIKHPELRREIEQLLKSANDAVVQAAETDNNAAFKANLGRATWAAGVLEGIKREGPNYELFQRTQNEKAKTIQKEEVTPDLEVESVTSLDPASGVALSATDSLINKLEGMKFAESATGVYSLPHPQAIGAVGKAVWNTGIDIAIASVKAGKQLKEAIDDALSYIKKNAKGFDETQVRQNLESLIEREMGTQPGMADTGKQAAPTAAPSTERIQNNTSGTTSESVRMRNLSARGTQAPSVPKPVQERIGNAQESFYPQQSMAKVEDLVKGMTDQDLGAVTKDSDIYTAAKLEQASRLFDAGKNDSGYQIYQELSTELTRLGQVINQAKLLTGMRPENVIKVVNEGLKKAGKDVLNPEQSGRVLESSKKRVEAQKNLDQATEVWRKDPTDANAIAAEKALLESNEAALAEQRLAHRFQDRSMSSLLKSILQGNLLTPISQVANVVGNVNFAPFRGATRAIAAGIDMVDATIRNRPRQVSVGPVSGTKAAVSGAIKGLKQVPDIMMRGMGDVVKGEQRAGLHPLRAWVTQLAKNPDAPTVGGRIPIMDRAKLAIEGTLGIPAEMMLRGLGSGDIAFREAARARLISEHARLKNVPEGQRRMAQNFPELFFDRETMRRIDEETLGAIFQRHSKTLDHLLSWTKSKGDGFDLFLSTIAPYKMTPWNIVGEILSYNPIVAFAKTGWEAKKGNTRAAEMNAGKMVVGSTLILAGNWLYNKGLLAPSMDSRDEQQKARILAGEVLPPNHINVSGLKRALEGGDPAFQPGDETRDIFRGGGLAGSMFYLAANTGRDREIAEADDNPTVDLIKNSTLEQARFGLNQSFLKGVVSLLDAVRDGEADNLLQSYAGTILSVPLPNTLSALSRAEREYKVDISADKMAKQVENVVRNRLGAFGMDDYLPLKRGLWGEPLRERPESANALVREFFDISKADQVTDDPVSLELYRLWRKTADTSVVPTPPEKTLTFARTTYNLSPEQRSRLTELVGNQRRDIVERLVVNPSFHELSDEGKIKMLHRVYDMGSEVGRAKFWMESGGQLTQKPEKAGFK